MESLILLEDLRFLGVSVGTSVSDWYAKTSMAGVVVLGMLMIATLLVKPRRWNVTKLFFMLLFLLYGGFVGGVYVPGFLFQLIM